MLNPMIGMPQGAEWLVILAIVVLVFGAAKLPDLARGTGQALRIFKAETKGLRDDEDDDVKDTTTPPGRPAAGRAAADRRPGRSPGPRTARPTRTTAEPGRPERPWRSAVSFGSSPASPSTPSATTAGWRSRTTSESCAPAS